MQAKKDKMIRLLDLPYEVLGNVLQYMDPETWTTTRLSCKTLKALVDQTPLLYKDYYLEKWDNPMDTYSPISKRWEDDVKRFIKTERILLSDNGALKRDNFQLVSQTILDLVKTAAPEYTSRNITLLRRLFQSVENKDIFLCGSTTFSRARVRHDDSTTIQQRQASAKLHCLHGKVISECYPDSPVPIYPWACSKVYDLRNYTLNTQWGPFLNDGSGNVDWEFVEAIMIVLTHNLQLCRVFVHRFIAPVWNDAFSGVASGSYILKPNLNQLAPPDSLLEDPYGISGTWMRVVCFLDYTELFAYNFGGRPVPAGEPREALNRNEAIRMIVMNIKITKIESPGENDGQALPVVHFHGNSRPKYAAWDLNAVAHVRGYVRLTKENEVQWTTFSIYHGEERWRSEGIQIGGVRSGRGVVGCWFDKDYDRHGPAGPTAFWKISDKQEFGEDDDDIGETNAGDSETPVTSI